MTVGLMVFICLLIINTVVAIIYLLWSIKNKRKSHVIKACVILLCPILGMCFWLLSYLWYHAFFSVPVDLEDVIFSKERVKIVTHAEEERERNVVPLEEAIEVTDVSDLRALMLNVVRGDIKKFLSAISLALNSEDSETAHYAASVLQDALNNFRISVEKQRQLVLEEDENRKEYAEMMMDYMNEVLEQRVFTDMEQENYVGIMDEICEIYYENYANHMLSSQFEAISMRLLEIGDYASCQKWCERARYHYPSTLSTFTCQLKLYFTNGEKQRFFEVVEELKHSHVVVDRETLELLRVFR